MSNLVLYDGLCGLCNATVLWLLKIDRRRVLTFASLQGETAKQFPLAFQSSETIVSIFDFRSENQEILFRSDAVLQILQTVGGFWKVAALFRIIPKKIRDTVYDWVAQNRYRWFGKSEECRLPPDDAKYRFLP